MFLSLFFRMRGAVAHLVFRRRVLFFAFALFLFTLIGLAVSVYFFERKYPEGNIKNFFDALWFSGVTLPTIGYGDFFPKTGMGRMSTILFFFCGTVAFATAATEITALALSREQRRERGEAKVKFKNHLIICNNPPFEMKRIVEEVRKGETIMMKVVVVSLGERPFSDTPHLRWVSGDPAGEEILESAGLFNAHALVYFPRESGAVADNEANMVLDTVKAMAPHVRVGILFQKEENRKHFSKTPAVNAFLTAILLLIQELQDRGTIAVVETLISNLEQQTLYALTVPAQVVGKTFREVYLEYEDILPIAFVRGADAKPIVNPSKSTILAEGDALIVIAPSRPKF
jgi:voltage-gated potassium channel